MKKFLAIILATLMLVAMLPAGVVSAEYVKPDTKTWGFTSGNTYLDGSTPPANANLLSDSSFKTSTGLEWRTTANSATGASLMWLRSSGIQTTFAKSAYAKNGYSDYPTMAEVSNPNYPASYVIINVTQAGRYLPYYQLGTGYKDCVYDVYLIKVTDANKNMSAAELLQSADPNDRLGSYHSCATADCPNKANAMFVQTGSGCNFSGPEVDLEVSEYFVLTAVTAACNSVTSFVLPLQTLTLTGRAQSSSNAAKTGKDADMAVSAGSADVVANDAGASATVNALARDVFGNEVVVDDDSIIEVISGVAAGSEQTVTAPNVDGYKFAYWSKGLGTKNRPVSETNEYSFKATSGATYLYAVYEPKDAADQTIVEFYDINGEIVSRQSYDANSTINAPVLPEATGRGAATAWVSANGKYDDLAAGASFTVPSDRNIVTFIAQYDEEAIDTVTVTAAGSTDITGAGTVDFGSTVTLVAPARENSTGNRVFAYWTKNGEVVSFDKSYSFVATADVTVTAVYQNYKPTAQTSDIKKILFNTLGTGEIVAEFIGCDSAIERGFIFGGDTLGAATNKATMKTNAKTFSMINDLGVSAKAYAIFADGVVYSK